jgi:hypothetical protein
MKMPLRRNNPTLSGKNFFLNTLILGSEDVDTTWVSGSRLPKTGREGGEVLRNLWGLLHGERYRLVARVVSFGDELWSRPEFANIPDAVWVNLCGKQPKDEASVSILLWDVPHGRKNRWMVLPQGHSRTRVGKNVI